MMNLYDMLAEAGIDPDSPLTSVDGLEPLPRWIDAERVTLGTLAEAHEHGGEYIIEGGCYMPAVTYHLAWETMSEHEDDILAEVDDGLAEALALANFRKGNGMRTLACSLLTAAAGAVFDRLAAQLEDILN